ncbi:MAG: imidazolonepropionase [Ignavibacteriae bacterium]|nr:MAG: imidazolonepropionase [Ignavibacteriota bacterium]
MDLLIKNIKQLVTVRANGKPFKSGKEMRDLGIIENATILIQNGLFKWIGSSSEFDQPVEGHLDVIDATESVGLPGFVDSHTHLLFAGSREDEFAMRVEGKSYQEIAQSGGGILNTVRATRTATKKELKKLARRHLETMLTEGTTTVEIKSGYGLTEKDEIKMLEAISDLTDECLMDVVPTFLGAHAVPPEFKDHPDGYVNLICTRMLPYIAQRKLAVFCDAFCEQGYFSVAQCRTIFETAKKLGMEIKIHADQFTQTGASNLAAESGARSADHLEQIDDAGIAALKKSGTVATVLPGASFFLNSRYPDARKMIDADLSVAIATDFNPGSCMSYSMPMMMTIACTHMALTPEEAITAATLNGAAALGLSEKLGSIEIGKQADIVLYDVPGYRYLPYHFGTNHVAKVIKHGTYFDF